MWFPDHSHRFPFSYLKCLTGMLSLPLLKLSGRKLPFSLNNWSMRRSAALPPVFNDLSMRRRLSVAPVSRYMVQEDPPLCTLSTRMDVFNALRLHERNRD